MFVISDRVTDRSAHALLTSSEPMSRSKGHARAPLMVAMRSICSLGKTSGRPRRWLFWIKRGKFQCSSNRLKLLLQTGPFGVASPTSRQPAREHSGNARHAAGQLALLNRAMAMGVRRRPGVDFIVIQSRRPMGQQGALTENAVVVQLGDRAAARENAARRPDLRSRCPRRHSNGCHAVITRHCKASRRLRRCSRTVLSRPIQHLNTAGSGCRGGCGFKGAIFGAPERRSPAWRIAT